MAPSDDTFKEGKCWKHGHHQKEGTKGSGIPARCESTFNQWDRRLTLLHVTISENCKCFIKKAFQLWNCHKLGIILAKHFFGTWLEIIITKLIRYDFYWRHWFLLCSIPSLVFDQIFGKTNVEPFWSAIWIKLLTKIYHG